MERYDLGRGTVDVHRAWTVGEIRSAVDAILADREPDGPSTVAGSGGRLPADRATRILVKPNLNNDLVALTGNSVDLRVLCALLEGLRDRGYTDVVVADGPNVGIERRHIDVFRRLRVRALEQRYGVRLVDLNRSQGRPLPLDRATPTVSTEVLDAGFVISVPKVKTHAEAGLSCACKNWVGICVGQDKRAMHVDLGRHIATIAGLVPPDLVIVDGVIGMDGNGPGDGDPVRLGVVMAGDDPFLVDLAACRVTGIDWKAVPYLVHGRKDGRFDDDVVRRAESVPLVQRYRLPPPRRRLAVLSERRELLWLKKLVRPIVSKPRVTELAYRAKIVQDVYRLDDDTITGVRRDPSSCGTCRRCEDFCPTGLKVEEIGVKTDPQSCVGCLYCWWACPQGAIAVEGDLNAMERQVQRYKATIERL